MLFPYAGRKNPKIVADHLYHGNLALPVSDSVKIYLTACVQPKFQNFSFAVSVVGFSRGECVLCGPMHLAYVSKSNSEYTVEYDTCRKHMYIMMECRYRGYENVSFDHNQGTSH